jgi:hexosaminidase
MSAIMKMMVALISFCAALACVVSAAPLLSRLALMPVPAKLERGSGRFAIDTRLTVTFAGHRDARLEAGVARALRRLEGRTGLEFAGTAKAEPRTDPPAVIIEAAGPGFPVPALEEDESYTLTITSEQARLKAPTVIGVLRGLETLLQLVESDHAGHYLPAATIADTPRFRWRGLLIDVSRHWMPKEVLERNLDAMAAVKLNVLHLHLTDDQGFRVESRRYPKLHQMGSDGRYFTQDEIRELHAYAHERGIRIVPEFDMPGHATSWLVGHPELASAPGPYAIERKWGIFDPTLDPTREEVYKVLDGFLSEMAALFPDAYLHIGGDENEGKQWNANSQIKAFMTRHKLADTHALQGLFNQRLLKILQKNGKKMVGWDEILQPDLPRDVVVQSWRGQKSLAEGARRGYQGILSNGYYLDHILPTSQHYAVDPVPANLGLTDAEAARIFGGEACMWAEFVSPETIDSRIWPRMAAIAERFWSPREVNDVDDMYRRLAIISRQLEEHGLTHEKNPPMMLRRLAAAAAGEDIAPLETLASVVEPVKFYRRGALRPATQMMPLTRLVDAARPDSAHARAFAADVRALVGDAPQFKSGRERVRARLRSWRDVRPAFDRFIARSAALKEAAPLASDLADVGTVGLEALQYLEGRATPPAGWREKALARLDEAGRPKAEVEFPMLVAVRTLVVAAAEIAAFDDATAEEWRRKVEEAAIPPKRKP